MAHYRKIDTRISLDRRFNALSPESKLLFFHLLTHMHLTSVGAMKITLPGLACELNFSPAVFEPAFQALCDQEMVLYDSETHFLWLPQFLKYNAPESPNAIRAWESALNYLPECDLREVLIRHAVVYVQTLSPAFQEALPKTFSLETAPSENFPPIPLLSVSSSQERVRVSASKKEGSDQAEKESANPLDFQQANPQAFIEVLPQGSVNPSETLKQDLTKGFANASESLVFQGALPKTFVLAATLSENVPSISSVVGLPSQDEVAEFKVQDSKQAQERSLNSVNLHLSERLTEVLLKGSANSQEALALDLPKGFGKTSRNPSEGLAEDLRQVLPIQGTKNKEQRAKNKEQITRNKEQEESQIFLEKNVEKKLNIEEITHIVAPTRQKIAKASSIEIREVFEHWKQTLHHPQAVLDDKRQRLIRQALASGYSVAQLCEAINGCAQTPHNLGDNERGQRYDGLHIILRDADQIDRFIQNAKSPPRPQSAADRLLKTNVMAGNNWLSKKLAEGKTYG